MRSENSLPEEDLVPFGAPQENPVDPSVRATANTASSGTPKRSGRALRPLWYSPGYPPLPHSPAVSGPEGITGDGPTLTSIVAG